MDQVAVLRVLDAQQRLVGREGRLVRAGHERVRAAELERLGARSDPLRRARRRSERYTPNPSRSLIAATVTFRPIARPSSQPVGRPSRNGSAVPPANGAATHSPDSSPVVSRCQTTHSPSGVTSPDDEPDRLARDLPALARRAIPRVQLVDAALRGGVDQAVGCVAGPVREADDRRVEAGLPQWFAIGHARQDSAAIRQVDLSQSREPETQPNVRCYGWRRSNR